MSNLAKIKATQHTVDGKPFTLLKVMALPADTTMPDYIGSLCQLFTSQGFCVKESSVWAYYVQVWGLPDCPAILPAKFI